jgi:hypothetical protein
MMIQPQGSIPAEMDHKKELLHAIYGVYARWVERFPLACQKGCAACCTNSVIITSLEGEIILDFVIGAGLEKWLLEKLAGAAPEKGREAITMNQFAGACLNHQEVDQECVPLAAGALVHLYNVQRTGLRKWPPYSWQSTRFSPRSLNM